MEPVIPELTAIGMRISDVHLGVWIRWVAGYDLFGSLGHPHQLPNRDFFCQCPTLQG
jgi:hypothetical protein